MNLLGSCSSVIQGVGALVISTTYPSSDEAIYAVENHYKELEASLNQQINEMEKKHPGYEEYRYQIDEITHNPYHLISYLTAKYGEFTYEEVKEELKKLLQKQYKLETNSKTEITTETKFLFMRRNQMLLWLLGIVNGRQWDGRSKREKKGLRFLHLFL